MDPRSEICKEDQFRFHVSNNNIIVFNDRNEDIEVTSSEADHLCTLLAGINSVLSFKVLPPRIKADPFTVYLNEDGSCLLTRDNEDRGLHFPLDKAMYLMQGYRTCITKIKDVIVQEGGRNNQAPMAETPDPLIEGRG